MSKEFTARRGLRASFLLILVTVLLVPTALSSAASAAPAPVPRAKVAGQGARWIAEQIVANGGYLESFGSPDLLDTAYAVIGLRTAHVGQTASDLAIGFLKSQLGAALQQGGSDAPGALAYDIMAAVTAGEDPAHFGGTAPQNDLVARLTATQQTAGADAGLFGTQFAMYDGAFRQGLALAALKAAKVKPKAAAVVTGIAWLTNQQCANGLWQPYRSNTAAPCAAADPNTFSGPDTNSSAMAMQGLAAWGQRPLQTQAVASLHAVQTADGGFPYIAAPGLTSDPNSTALVIQGLIAEQQHPARVEWSTVGGNPFSALASYQLGCTDAAADRGAFFFPGDRSPNVFATVQAVPAMRQRKFPVAKIANLKPLPAPVVCAN